MDQVTLTNAQQSIQNIKVCAELQAYKNQILTLMQAEQAVLIQKLADLGSLTNPVTFIANYILIATRELAAVETLMEGLVGDIITIATLLEEQAAKLPKCNLT